RYPVLRVHVILMPTRLWPTASAISSGVGFPASLAGMSATVPVAVPLGSPFGSGFGSSALTTLTSSTNSSSNEQSFHDRRIVCLLLSEKPPSPYESKLSFLRPEIVLRGEKVHVCNDQSDIQVAATSVRNSADPDSFQRRAIPMPRDIFHLTVYLSA